MSSMRALLLLAAVCCLASLVAGARLRSLYGEGGILQQQPSQQQQPQPALQQETNPLFSFLQQHQRAFQAQQQQQQHPQQQSPSQADDFASAGDVLAALEHAHAHAAAPYAEAEAEAESEEEVDDSALVQTDASTHTETEAETEAETETEADGQMQTREGEGEGDFGPCKTCVFVLERIKKGSNMLLPAICSELYHKYPDAYALCHQVLNALSINGNNVRYWLFEGCFKYEIYQSKEWIKPCPSHVMCSVLKDLAAQPFCPALPMENPFADA